MIRINGFMWEDIQHYRWYVATENYHHSGQRWDFVSCANAPWLVHVESDDPSVREEDSVSYLEMSALSDQEKQIAERASRRVHEVGANRIGFNMPREFYVNPEQFVRDDGRHISQEVNGLTRAMHGVFCQRFLSQSGFFYAYKNGIKGWVPVWDALRMTTRCITNFVFLSSEAPHRMNSVSGGKKTDVLSGSVFLVLGDRFGTRETFSQNEFENMLRPIDITSCKSDGDIRQMVICMAMQAGLAFEGISLAFAVQITEAFLRAHPEYLRVTSVPESEKKGQLPLF